jgi:uncharacterized protein
MPATLCTFTIPLLTRGLSVLSDYMDKAATHAKTLGIDPAALVSARLAPDMMPLSGQVQSACDKAKNGVARLTGTTAPAYADTETTLEELKARIAKTLLFLNAVTPAQFEGAGDRVVTLRDRTMTGHVYLTQILLPDFYFHIATAHGILRHNGLAIGKADYLGKLDVKA